MKTFELKETKNPDLFRVMDRNGNWSHYFHNPTNRYLRSVNAILDGGYARPELEDWLKSKSSAEVDDILERTGDKGDKVHRAIDLMLTGAPRIDRNTKIYSKLTKQDELLTNEEWDCLLSFESFWKAHAPVLYSSEAPVFSLKEGYAGTADAILKLTKACEVKMCKCEDLIGIIGIWDWKSGSGIYSSQSAQVAAYAKGDNIASYLPPKKKLHYIGILRVGTRHKTTGGYELKTFNISESYSRFLSSKTIADYDYTPFTDESVHEIPDEIVLSVDVYVKPTKITKAKKKLAKSKTISHV